eukprot:bmy_22114T0
MQLPFCSHHQVDHFICEVPVFIQLACVDTTFTTCERNLSPLFWNYGYIYQAVLKIKLATGRKKAFETSFLICWLSPFSMEPSSSCICSQPRVEPRTRECLSPSSTVW